MTGMATSCFLATHGMISTQKMFLGSMPLSSAK